MRLLFISSDAPTDLQTAFEGIQRRMGMFVEALGRLGQLDVLLYVAPDTDSSPIAIAARERSLSAYWNVNITLFQCPKFEPHPTVPLWQQQVGGIVSLFRQPGFIRTSQPAQVQALETCLQRQPAAIFVHRLQSMCPVLRTRHPLPPVFFDLDDIEHIKLLRSINQPPSSLITRLYGLHIPVLWQQECHSIRLAARSFICSDHDHDYLANRWQLPGVTVIPNAISIPATSAITPEPTLLLLGTYSYPPNNHAANFLIEQVFPLVQQQMPEARLLIAGSAADTIRAYDQSPTGVEFTGFVQDLKALYRRSRVVCCPIFSGGGTRVKMIEAAAYGKPIVASRIGAEGLEMRPDQDFLLRDSAAEYAAACVQLLKNDDLCHRLGTNARAAAIQHYDRANIVNLVQHHIRSGLQPSEALELSTYSDTSVS
ncbi:glycosyltransferase family 4 protein [Phormidium sp. CLA17]|uniref:glycosyltransferase family 4 protein n=1 Tax=Leptolyngbya sp. Cla-17 TaxID=2803751 RepID=UPI001490A9CB|nr:glycosyltransferase family 4 protein [Leptolyngbya sp. Cla-17]MBM0741370.1 glycosyltransferase family 4 protein [Leptolyngbya sp. Cla-17]